MGTLLKAKCTLCNYENARINFGASMEEAEARECYVPALKNNSSSIEMINIRNKANHNNYIFYTDPLFYENNDEGYYNAWEFKLMKKYNLCPFCKKYEMEFIYRGEYD